ncbi:MAG: DUF5615 family PIN-like protein [Rhodoferax sp.]
MASASDKDVWQKAKDDGYVIVTRDADFQELSLAWGQPPNDFKATAWASFRYSGAGGVPVGD